MEESEIPSTHLSFIYNFLISALGLLILINGVGEVIYYAFKIMITVYYGQTKNIQIADGFRISFLDGINLGGIIAGIMRIIFGSILFFAPVLVTDFRAKVLGFFSRRSLRDKPADADA